jgi:hypothetical protein
MAYVSRGKDGNTRATHWIKANEQNRIPKRWIAFDTESKSAITKEGETQSWRMGAAMRWRRDVVKKDVPEPAIFDDPIALWLWVTEFCVSEVRTVVTAHNLGYDIRISQALEILPRLGWRLEWSNLDRNVSAMVWRSNKGTLVFSDLFTWLPYPLREIGHWLKLEKGDLPDDGASSQTWENYCLRDVDIVRRCVQDIVNYIESDDIGNWQPTGAGTAYSMWRHRFMPHRVLVHDDVDLLALERQAMHTGRAEAWRHGSVLGDTWYEVDMKSAYTWIAAEYSLPVKFKYKGGKLSNEQYRELSKFYAICAKVTVLTDEPIVPYDNGQRTIWPIGEFETVLWDVEIDELLGSGATVRITQYATYVRKPALAEWAEYIIDRINGDMGVPSLVIAKWLKHCGRALIGRLSLRIPSWEYWGDNVEGITGISYELDTRTGLQKRMLHVGHDVFEQTARDEAKDSLPQITGFIMAVCRVRLWQAMRVAGLDNIAHVDTDCVLVNKAGLAALKAHFGDRFQYQWQIKGQFSRLDVYGPRNYRTGNVRKVAGVPRKAKEVSPGQFTGEMWMSVGNDMESGRSGTVTIKHGEWDVKMIDPRRLDAPGGDGKTVAILL